jgi:hypothetical protein
MKDIVKNPFIMGAAGGAFATGIHYINHKIVKKEEKVETNDLVKIFVIMSLLVGGSVFFLNKKKLLTGKLSSSANISSASAYVPPPVAAPVPTPAPLRTQQVGGAYNTAPVSLPANIVSAAPVNMGVPNQTISSMPSAAQPSLVLSDISDVIHTGTPNF